MKELVSLALSMMFLLPTSVHASNQIDCESLEKIFNTKVDACYSPLLDIKALNTVGRSEVPLFRLM